MIALSQIRVGMRVKALCFGTSRAYELRDFHHIGTVTRGPHTEFVTVRFQNLRQRHSAYTVCHMLPEELEEVE